MTNQRLAKMKNKIICLVLVCLCLSLTTTAAITDFEDFYNEISMPIDWYGKFAEDYSNYYGVSLDQYLKLYPPYNSNEDLGQLAQDLRSDTVEETIENIEWWIERNIKYNVSNKWHNSAIRTYELRQGVCDDSADLKITLLRLNGIYAREIQARLPYTKDGFDRHNLVEVLYPVRFRFLAWIPLDNVEHLRRIG